MRRGLTALGVVLAAAILSAQTPTLYQPLSVGTTPVGLQGTAAAAASSCRAVLSGGSIVFSLDESAPATPLNVGDLLVLQNARDVANFRGVATSTAGPARLDFLCGTGQTAASFIQPATVTLAGVDTSTGTRLPIRTVSGAVLTVTQPGPALPLPDCNPVMRFNCRPKNY